MLILHSNNGSDLAPRTYLSTLLDKSKNRFTDDSGSFTPFTLGWLGSEPLSLLFPVLAAPLLGCLGLGERREGGGDAGYLRGEQ